MLCLPLMRFASKYLDTLFIVLLSAIISSIWFPIIGFNSIGGFPLTPAPDVVFIVKALKKGWKIEVVTTTKFVHRRSQDNYKRYMKTGEHSAILGLHPVHAILIGLYLTCKKSYLGLAFMMGYFRIFFSLKRINDPEVFEYYRCEAFSNLIRKIKTKLLLQV